MEFARGYRAAVVRNTENDIPNDTAVDNLRDWF
jgi:hypothetical protein